MIFVIIKIIINTMKLPDLSSAISQTHIALQSNAIKAINRNLTLRNWLIGFYIVEFEQKGGGPGPIRHQPPQNTRKTNKHPRAYRNPFQIIPSILYHLSTNKGYYYRSTKRHFCDTLAGFCHFINSCDTVTQITTPFSNLSDTVGRITKR